MILLLFIHISFRHLLEQQTHLLLKSTIELTLTNQNDIIIAHTLIFSELFITHNGFQLIVKYLKEQQKITKLIKINNRHLFCWMSYQTWACLVVFSAYCHLVSFNTHLSFTLLIILFLTYIFFPFWDWFVFGLGNWLELVGVLPSFRCHYLIGSIFILDLIPKLNCFINKIICFKGHYKYNNSSYREDV